MRFVSLVVPCSLLWRTTWSQTVPQVQVENGTIIGAACPFSQSNAFLGIPYAQAPIDELRFASPQPYNQTFPNGSLNASTPPPACIQFGSEFLEVGAASEDCLFLDVWTPQGVTNTSKLPVMFWIYGGEFKAGGISNALYDGCYLANDVVVVSANYRLGPLGWLTLPDAGVKGNMGVQDLLMALQWVQDNIASFGGDPAKVAVFGQSAGGVLTWTLSSLSEAKSLMRAGIAESGAGTPLSTLDNEVAFWSNYSTSLGCNSSDINCLQSISTEQLNATLINIPLVGSSSNAISLKVYPYVDGSVIPAEPATVGAQVPLMAGTTSQEATIFLTGSFPDPASLTEANYTADVQALFKNESAPMLSAYPYSDFTNDSLPAFDGIVQVLTDEDWLCANVRALASTSKAGVAVYAYQWGHVPTCPWYPFIPQAKLAELGAAHTSEIAFAFNHTTHLPAPNGTCSFNADEVEISNSLSASWKSMAAIGNPGSNLASAGTWPIWNANSSMGLVVRNETTTGFINYTICNFWTELAANVSNSSGGSTASDSSSTSGGGSSSTSGSSSRRLESLNFVILLMSLAMIAAVIVW